MAETETHVVVIFETVEPDLPPQEQLHEVFGPFTEAEADDFCEEWLERATTDTWHLVIQPLRREKAI